MTTDTGLETTIFNPQEKKSILKAKKNVVEIFFTDVYNPLVKKCRGQGMIEPSMHNIVVAGGVFSSLLRGDVVNDFDVFVLNSDAAQILAIKTFLEDATLFNQDTTKDSSTYGDKASKINKNIIRTLSAALVKRTSPPIHNKINPAVFGPFGLRIQFIFTSYKTQEELLAHFDFVHCKVNYSPFKGELYITYQTYDAIMNKHLISAEGIKPSQWRINKFEDRGWKLKGITGYMSLDNRGNSDDIAFEQLFRDLVS